jgi:hypothetical protein
MTNEAKKRAGSFAAAKEQWLKLVASYPNLSGADLAVAVMLSTYLNSKRGDAWPSVRRLAADTNRDLRTVFRSLRRLEQLDLVSVIHGRGPKKSNRYRPALGRLNLDPKTLRPRPRGKDDGRSATIMMADQSADDGRFSIQNL